MAQNTHQVEGADKAAKSGKWLIAGIVAVAVLVVAYLLLASGGEVADGESEGDGVNKPAEQVVEEQSVDDAAEDGGEAGTDDGGEADTDSD